MAAFFSETFPGSGSIGGKAPDTAYGGQNWVLDFGTADEVSGYLVVPGTSPEYDSPASVTYGDTTGYSLPTSVVVSFTWRSGAIVSTSGGGASPSGLQMQFLMNDITSVNVVLQSYYNSTWDLSIDDTVSEYSAVADVTSNIAPNTDYTGTLAYSLDGEAVLSFLGQTITIIPSATGGVGGFRRLAVLSGSYHKLGFIAVDALAVPTGFPKLTLTGYGGGGTDRDSLVYLATPSIAAFGGARAGLNFPMPTVGGASYPEANPFFHETFTGSGSVELKVPDIGFPGTASNYWEDQIGTTTFSGGKASNASPIDGFTRISYRGDLYTSPTNFTLTANFTTGASVAPAGNGHKGIVVTFTVEGDAIFAASLYAPASSGWLLDVTGGSGVFNNSVSFPSITANTNYTLAIVGDKDGLTATVGGVSVTNAESRAGITGIQSGLKVSIGGTILLDEVQIARTGTSTPGTGTAALTLPMLRLSAPGNAALSLPSVTLGATGHNADGERSLSYTFSALTLSAYGAGKAVMSAPSPSLSVTGTFANSGSAVLAAPTLALSSTGRVSNASSAALTMPTAQLIGYGGALLSVTVGSATMAASGTSGSVGRAAVSLPLFDLTATGTVRGLSSADLTAPALSMVPVGKAVLILPGLTLTAIGSAVITATYEAYAVNLNHKAVRGVEPVDEMTRYTSFPFTQVVRYQNSYFGLGADGNLYLLEGTTDNGTAIPWAFKTAITDFDTPLKKTIASAYFGGRFGPASAIALYPGEDGVTTYSYSTPRDALAQNHRQKFGKGLKERYYAVGVSGTGTLELDSIELDVHNMTRRI